FLFIFCHFHLLLISNSQLQKSSTCSLSESSKSSAVLKPCVHAPPLPSAQASNAGSWPASENSAGTDRRPARASPAHYRRRRCSTALLWDHQPHTSTARPAAAAARREYRSPDAARAALHRRQQTYALGRSSCAGCLRVARCRKYAITSRRNHATR